MKSKTIILSPTENQNSRGILTLYLEDDLLKVKLRLYSMPNLTPACKIGIYHNNEVFTANIIERNGQYESSLVGEFNMSNDFYCAIINTQNNNQVLLAGGTYAGYYFNDTSVFSPAQNNEIDNTEQFNQAETQTPNCEDCNKCATCKYKEFFYSQTQEIATQTQETPPQKEEQKITNSTINSLSHQFDYVFNTYPPDQNLTNLVPNSKFVKITENLEEYSIGAIYENEQIKYICYAIKSNYNTAPPTELGKNYQWLPQDNQDPLSEGYYLVFQDSNDLKILSF